MANPTIEAETLLDVGDVAALLKVSTPTVYRWHYKGHGPPALKIGQGSLRWRMADVQAWLDSKASQ